MRRYNCRFARHRSRFGLRYNFLSWATKFLDSFVGSLKSSTTFSEPSALRSSTPGTFLNFILPMGPSPKTFSFHHVIHLPPSESVGGPSPLAASGAFPVSDSSSAFWPPPCSFLNWSTRESGFRMTRASLLAGGSSSAPPIASVFVCGPISSRTWKSACGPSLNPKPRRESVPGTEVQQRRSQSYFALEHGAFAPPPSPHPVFCTYLF